MVLSELSSDFIAVGALVVGFCTALMVLKSIIRIFQ